MTTADADVSFKILGPIECRDVVLGPQQRRLLALLLVNANRTLSYDHMIECLWEEQPLGFEAKRRLQVSVVRLRQAVRAAGAGAVLNARGGYQLTVGAGALDAELFSERARQGRRTLDAQQPEAASALLASALALWRGPALAEVAEEPFAVAEVRRLEQLRVTTLEARIDADLALHREAELVAELEGLVTEHPTHEGFSRQLMVALYRSGRQTAALEAFQRTRAQLTEHFGLEPGPALRLVQAQVLAQDAALDVPGHTAEPAVELHLPFLILRAGHPQQSEVALDPSRTITVGRSTEADVAILWDGQVSRLHALLEHIGGAWLLSDEGLSSNGTYCNDERVSSRRRLIDGDVLRLGSTTIVYRDPGDEEDRTLSRTPPLKLVG